MNDDPPPPAELLAKEATLRAALDKAERLFDHLRTNFQSAFDTAEAEAARRFAEAQTALRESDARVSPDDRREREARAAERERLRKAEALRKHEAARLRLDQIGSRLRELNTLAPHSTEPAGRSSGDGENADAEVSLAELEAVLAEAETYARELAEPKARQKAWRDAVAAHLSAIDDLETKTARRETPAVIETAAKALRKAASARDKAAREASVSPDAAPGTREASERARAALAAADRLLGKFRLLGTVRRLAISVLCILVVASLAHFWLLARSSIVVRVVLAGKLPEAGAVEAFWNGKPLGIVGYSSKDTSFLRVPRLGRGELRIVAPGHDDFVQEMSLDYGTNLAGPAELPRSKGRLAVMSDLPGAKVRIENDEDSAAGLAPGSFELRTGDYTVVVSKDFVQASARASVVKGRETAVHVPVPRGGLELSALPAKSRFTLLRDGEALIEEGELPASLADLPPGDYRIKFRFDKTALLREATVNVGETGTLRAVLPLGDLRIATSGTAEPPSFRVLRAGNEEASGQAPALLQNLPEGDLEVAVSDGAFSLLRTVKLQAGEETLVSADFSYGGAKIESVPSPAAVELTRPGQTPLKGKTPFEAPKLLAGEYAVRLVFDGIEHSGSLMVKPDEITPADFTLPIGSIRIFGGAKGAEHQVERPDGTPVKAVLTNEETALRSGDYIVKSRYGGGIVLDSPVTIQTSRRTDLDPFASTGTLYLSANAPGTNYELRFLGTNPFTLSGSAPARIEYLPYGRYAAKFVQEAEGCAQDREFEFSKVNTGARAVFSRNVFAAALDPDMTRFDALTENFAHPRSSVWDAVYARCRTGNFRENPYRDNATAGWVVSKRYVYADSLSLTKPGRACHHVALVTDMGDHVEVQVVTVLWKITTKTQPTISQIYSLDIDLAASRELSKKFLEDVRGALAR